MLLKSIVIALIMVLGVAIVAFYGQGPTTTNPEEAAIGRSRKPITLLTSQSPALSQVPTSSQSLESEKMENQDTSKTSALITAR
jgi:hypothetical protein